MEVGSERAERHGDQIGDQERQRGELEGHGQAGEQLRADRHVVLERVAEIAAQHAAKPREVLDVQRPIEAVLVLEPGDRLRRGVDAERRLGRGARHHVDGDEQDERGGDQGGNERQQAERDQPQHQREPVPPAGVLSDPPTKVSGYSNQASFNVFRKPVRIGW